MEKEERGRILADVADSLGVSEPEALSQFREQARNRQREKEPLVCCVTLTKDRPQMLQLAIACFRTQTYQRKRLVILDGRDNAAHVTWEPETAAEVVIHSGPAMGLKPDLSIGRLRNVVNLASDRMRADIIVHMDDDDWSHPERIAEQVALLQASGKECVGYREMLFWDQREGQFCGAWLYTNGNPRYCLGTSLCYWRSVWERRPFEDKAYGEDTAWLLGVDSLAGSMYGSECFVYPRMIASIHGGNTSPAYRGELMRASEKQGGEWKRAPQWDDYARGIMEGECSSARP